MFVLFNLATQTILGIFVSYDDAQDHAFNNHIEHSCIDYVEA